MNITMRQEEIRLSGNEKPTPENATMLSGKLKVTISTPFEGNSLLFKFTRAEKISDFRKKVKVQHQNKILQLFYEVVDRNADRLKSIVDRDIRKIKDILDSVNKEILAHNLLIKENAKTVLPEQKKV